MGGISPHRSPSHRNLPLSHRDLPPLHRNLRGKGVLGGRKESRTRSREARRFAQYTCTSHAMRTICASSAGGTKGNAVVKKVGDVQMVRDKERRARAVAPLLVPERDQLPFALGLEICGAGARNNAKQRVSGAWTLHYVLEGCAEFKAGEKEEVELHLGAGDGLIIPPDVLRSLQPCQSSTRAEEGQVDVEWEFASLVAYLPECLVDPHLAHKRRTSEALRVAQALVDEAWSRSDELGTLRQDQVVQMLEGAKRRHGSSSSEEDGESTDDGSEGWELDRTDGELVSLRKLKDVDTYQLPNQTNRLALMFDPVRNQQINATFGVEVFEPGHITPLHVHEDGYELFFVLSGNGVGHFEGESFDLEPGSLAVFPPKTWHGIDNINVERLYCLELMLPNDMFAELVRSGKPVGVLDDDDLCTLINFGCG